MVKTAARPSTLPYEPPTPTRELTVPGVRVLLVYGARITPATTEQPGIRVTAGFHDGDVLLEAVGFTEPHGTEACDAIREAATACRDAGLCVLPAPLRASRFPARVVRRSVL